MLSSAVTQARVECCLFVFPQLASVNHVLSWRGGGMKSIKTSEILGKYAEDISVSALGVKGRAGAAIPNPTRLHGPAKALYFSQELPRVCIEILLSVNTVIFCPRIHCGIN